MSPIIWHKLPGPAVVKLLIVLIIIAAIFLALMEIVFPVISPYMPFNDVAVTSVTDTATSGVASATVEDNDVVPMDAQP